MNINTRFYGSNSIAEYGVGVCRIQYWMDTEIRIFQKEY